MLLKPDMQGFNAHALPGKMPMPLIRSTCVATLGGLGPGTDGGAW